MAERRANSQSRTEQNRRTRDSIREQDQSTRRKPESRQRMQETPEQGSGRQRNLERNSGRRRMDNSGNRSGAENRNINSQTNTGRKHRSGDRTDSRTGSGMNNRTDSRTGSRVDSRRKPRTRAAAGSNRKRRRPKRGFAAWPIWKKILIIVFGVLILLISLGLAILASKYHKINTKTLDTEALNISQEVTENVAQTGYLNVALFGLDTRTDLTEDVEGTRSDTIMIASINLETKAVKLCSVYRDTYLQQDDGTYEKANAAYSFGEAQEAVALLNKNLDMDIQHYVSVDFKAMVDVIDALGGIDIDVQQEEIDYINGYATEIIKNTGVDTWAVTDPGMQTLTGTQATAYARIRYTSGDDYRRTERQREVLTQIVKKAQNSNLLTINKIIDKVFPEIQTNFTLKEILSYSKDAMKYQLGETTGFPFDKEAQTLSGVGSVVLPMTLESNVTQLHQYFFGEDGYTPSSTVVAISGEIEDKASSLGTTDSDDMTYYNQDWSSDGTDYSGNYSSYGTGTTDQTYGEETTDQTGGTGTVDQTGGAGTVDQSGTTGTVDQTGGADTQGY